jgi:hypothetical protein
MIARRDTVIAIVFGPKLAQPILGHATAFANSQWSVGAVKAGSLAAKACV